MRKPARLQPAAARPPPLSCLVSACLVSARRSLAVLSYGERSRPSTLRPFSLPSRGLHSLVEAPLDRLTQKACQALWKGHEPQRTDESSQRAQPAVAGLQKRRADYKTKRPEAPHSPSRKRGEPSRRCFRATIFFNCPCDHPLYQFPRRSQLLPHCRFLLPEAALDKPSPNALYLYKGKNIF